MLSSRIEFCRAFLSENEEIYDSFNVLDSACETNSNVPIYKFIKDLNIVEILQHIEEISGTECKLYDLISNDKKDYIKNLGVKKDNINYNGALCKKEIENYYKTTKYIIITYLVTTIMIIFMSLVACACLGRYLIAMYQYPVYITLKKISIFGFIDRIENFLSIEWILSTFVTFTLPIINIQSNINKKNNKSVVFIFIGVKKWITCCKPLK